MTRMKTLALCAPLYGLMLAASPAMAQQAPAESQSGLVPTSEAQQNADTAADTQDIVVTAQKRAERLIDVPQSVTAVSSADLERLNATQFRDYANTIPGLQFTTQGAGQNQVTVRGVTTGRVGTPTVGVYVDDVPYGGSGSYMQAGGLSLDQGLFDLDRVEVLRGPQGTLYGASALGGVLKYVTIAPDTNGFGGSARAGVSDTRYGGVSYDGAAALNLPIATDKAAVRVGGYYSHDGGFVDDIGLGRKDVDRSRVYGARVDLLFKPTDRLSIRVVGAGQNINRDGQAAADFNFNGKPRSGDLLQRRVFAEPFDQRFRLASGTLNYDFGSFGLTSISSYQTVRSIQRVDYSPLFVPLLGSLGLPFGSTGLIINTNLKKFVQEVRLQSTGNGTIEWLVGGFFTHESNAQRQSIAATNPNGTPSPINLVDAQLPSHYEELAAFGNLTLNLTDRFAVTGGLRYAHNKQDFVQNATGLLLPSEPKGNSSEGVVTYLANAQYKFSRNANVYVRYATGYRAGGPNAVATDPVTGAPLAPRTFSSDNLKSYEAGLKAQTEDRTFAIDLAGYYVDWNNIQIATARNGITVVANAAAGARIYGSDLTLTARPSRDLTVTGAFGYADARLKAADPDLGGRSGERLPNVPKFTAAVGADYVMSGMSVSPRLGGTVRFVSDRRASFDANAGFPQYDLGDYVSVDLRAGARFGPVDAQVFARNLFDERGQLSADSSLTPAGGPVRVAITQPRTIGIALSTRF